MERISRTPFQGTINIVRFNWPFYVVPLLLTIVFLVISGFIPPIIGVIGWVACTIAMVVLLISIITSWYIYDQSGFYSFKWLEQLSINPNQRLVNITAGFDETSEAIMQKYPGSDLTVFDFYDARLHTEPSIKRARKLYPRFPGTIAIDTQNIPVAAGSVDCIFLIFAAHEIRSSVERIQFFSLLRNKLNPGGQIIVVEHLRDVYNFGAFNIGFFHFFSGKAWKDTFLKSNLIKKETFKFTPFVTIFVVSVNGTTT